MMPVMDGYETMRAMRELPAARATCRSSPSPARWRPGERERCIDAGASAYIPKPVETAELPASSSASGCPASVPPAASAAGDVDAAATVERRTRRGAAAILVVDDNAGKRLAIRAMLAPLGHAVVEADSGRAALRAVMRQTFAVILMDVRMPTHGRLRDGQADPAAQRVASTRRSSSSPRYGRDETETADRVRQRRRRLHLRADRRRRPAGEGLGLRRPLPAGARSCSARSTSITALNVEMLARLAAAAELRDDDTGQAHPPAASAICRSAIAERLGCPALEVGLIRLAAPLHAWQDRSFPTRFSANRAS